MAEDVWDIELPSDSASRINRARHETYGDSTPNMQMLAKLWSAYLSPIILRDLKPEDVAMMLVLLKVMREAQGGFKLDFQDNLVDICGWVNVAFRAKEARRGP